MRYLIALSLLLLYALLLPLRAISSDGDELIDAMVDESKRCLSQLHLKDYGAPYFINYSIQETESLELVSSLGSPPQARHSRMRYFTPDIRVGSRDLDNSNYGPTKDKYYSNGSFISTDNNYTAIRRTIWLKTDEAYKKAIETLEAKKAYLAANKIADRMPDMSEAKPVLCLDPVEKLSYDEQRWTEDVRGLSQVFLRYPQLQKSKVWFLAKRSNRWLVNSEGTRIRTSTPLYAVEIWANTQAVDGSSLSDQEVFLSARENGLPDFEKLKTAAIGLAERLTALRRAPQGQDYCGPVLFEGQAAAMFISDLFKPNLACAEDVVHPDTENKIPGNPLKDMLGRRILPRYMDLIDDPLSSQYKGQELLGGYKFDSEGVPAQRLVLAENGLLKGFCQSRTPTRSSAASNGHAYLDRSSTSVLELLSKQTLSQEQLRQKLMELARDEGLKYALILRRLQAAYSVDDKIPPDDPTQHDFPTHSLQPSQPVLAYKLDLATGKEELQRGLMFRFASLRSFRDIQAAGDDDRAYLVQPVGAEIRSLVTPSLLIGEMELQKQHPEHENPPTLDSPISEQNR